VDGHSATLGAGGAFTAVIPLTLGLNTIKVTATNLAGIIASTQRLVVYSRPPCVVPRLTGRTLARARAILLADGCIPGKVVRVHSRRVRRGKIVTTSPRAGTRRVHGAAIRIMLSDGAPRKRRR
jgi:beta-lactam-binding protein with PASTA domain